jgi:siroheme synthase-like protein
LKGNQLFPVFLKLNQLRTVIIGAGPVGLEKLTALLNQSWEANITIIALETCEEVRAMVSRLPQLTLYQKQYEAADLWQADIVIAATNNNVLNEEIKRDAHALKLLVNVADKPDLCDFYLGSIVKKGDLKIAISTNGKSPTIAKRLKELFNESLPEELDITLQQMSKFRNTLEGDFSEKVKKLNEVSAVLGGQPGVIEKAGVSPVSLKRNVPKLKGLPGVTFHNIALSVMKMSLKGILVVLGVILMIAGLRSIILFTIN